MTEAASEITPDQEARWRRMADVVSEKDDERERARERIRLEERDAHEERKTRRAQGKPVLAPEAEQSLQEAYAANVREISALGQIHFDELKALHESQRGQLAGKSHADWMAAWEQMRAQSAALNERHAHERATLSRIHEQRYASLR